MKNLLALTVIIFIFFLSCTKVKPDMSVPIALYTIGSNDTCTKTIVSGRYVADTAVTSTNTVTITVNVTKAGPYWITTDSTNGIIFSSIGTFDSTGIQTAVLVAAGTPDSVDTANFTIRPINGPGGSCTFSVVTVQGIAPHYYLTCFLNGVYRNFSDSAGASNSDIPGTSGQTGLDISGRDTILTSFEKIDFGVSAAGSVGPGNYTDSSASSAYFKYTDSLGQAWIVNSSAPPSFTVFVSGVSAGSVQGTFSGTIKNQQGSVIDSISVTNGVFSVPVH